VPTPLTETEVLLQILDGMHSTHQMPYEKPYIRDSEYKKLNTSTQWNLDLEKQDNFVN